MDINVILLGLTELTFSIINNFLWIYYVGNIQYVKDFFNKYEFFFKNKNNT